MTYRRTYRQSISNLNFRPHFWKNHQGYSSWFCQNLAFRHRNCIYNTHTPHLSFLRPPMVSHMWEHHCYPPAAVLITQYIQLQHIYNSPSHSPHLSSHHQLLACLSVTRMDESLQYNNQQSQNEIPVNWLTTSLLCS